MRIYLVQHGKAKPKDEDSDRHLTDNGLQETRKIAEFIRPLGLSVMAVWHSGKPRAVQTAEIFASAMKSEADLIHQHGLAPNDPVKPVIKEIKQAQRDLMIVGHMPFLDKLASKMLVGDEEMEVVAFKNSGIVCLDGDSDREWRLAWIITPDLIR